MDLYMLDSLFQKSNVIDVFDSLVWTERYNDAGDFTLVIGSSSEFKDILVEGVFLGMMDSREAMMIDTVSEENGEITLTGKSLVDIFNSRIFRDTWQTTKDSYNLTGVAGAIIHTLLSVTVAPAGAMSAGLIVPSNGSLEIFNNLDYATYVSDGPSLNVAVPYGNVFDAIKTVADLDSLGFTLFPKPGSVNGGIQFLTYRGRDLTTGQSTYPAVIFDPALDSLSDVKKLRSIAGYKNVAYAWANGMTAQNTIGVAVAPGASALTGFQRRTLMVDASDVNAADYTASALTAILNQKAADALANNNYVRTTDGQLVPQDTYVYGTDYTLGDVIELRDSGATAQKARILEYVRAQDSTGERSYPTLSVIS
jgi:hypothetical protein